MSIFRIIQIIIKATRNGLLILLYRRIRNKIFLLISFFISPFQSFVNLNKPDSEIIAKLAFTIQNLGPIFIKFGQTISTRPDLIGNDFANQLKFLQDKLESFETIIAIKIIESELGKKIEEIFLEFDKIPVASASIAQVHKAKLFDNRMVAVKILRPGIEEKYNSDIKILNFLARFFCFFSEKNKRLKPLEIVSIFKKTMNNELNLMREASACSELTENLKNDDNVIIPSIYWDYTTEKILTLSWIEEGISIYDTQKILSLNIDRKILARNLAVMFFNQAYRDGYFHADLHPGNIFVNENGKILLLDFGIMGRLPEQDRLAIAEILHSFLNKNYKKVAEIHVKVGYVPKDTNIYDFAQACRAVAEPILHKPTSEISIGKLLNRLFMITEEFGMQTQPQLILLQKTMVVVEGIGKQFDDSVNMWELAEPWIKSWAIKNITIDAKITKFIYKILEKLYTDLDQKNEL